MVEELDGEEKLHHARDADEISGCYPSQARVDEDGNRR